ncbi:protein FAR1-RELATED SEQUENCE 7-like [Salvia miltiorrhiza]|uniref:protein FAR1-RELATED SEQUENCE 7-like n=1 Tax=Salvia miltiorrhiza TaxID=226208 RepID=UPI0025ACF1F5|nr:protein FAR1-RELATED SEQUENCE 7-like [Salvia miltiorrhiza]
MEPQDAVNEQGQDNQSQTYMPIADDVCRLPYVGQVFSSLEEAFDLYGLYGYSCGFDVRKGTTRKGKYGQIIYQTFVCIREGINPGTNDEHAETQSKTKKRRRKPSTRCDCRANVIMKRRDSGEYYVSVFNEAHNHELISEDCRHFMKYNRKLDSSHQLCAKVNIGPMRAFRLFKELVGGYEHVGCTSNDFKKISYQMNSYPDGSDAQLLLERLITNRDLDDQFKVEYSMIFVPFTGKDNHGGCVTFAAGLLTREDVHSYSWILKQFVDCMGHSPAMLITNQDPALKIAVENVMPDTRHRWCMWHIMMKVALKLPISLRENADLTSRLYEVTWSELDEPSEFEEKWLGVINEYGLADNSWFSDMFSKRKYWIPAYFHDLRMSGLFRTTSMSESENSFFRKYLNRNSNLASFYIHYESAMQAQRYSYKQLCMTGQTTTPKLKSHKPIEQHASRIYTTNFFLDVQIEITEAFNRCRIKSMDTAHEDHMYAVDDRSNGVSNVAYNMVADTFTCSCKLFVKKGLVCRHMFVVMHNIGLKAIPEKYILDRWR